MEIRPIPTALQEKAKLELNEVPSRIEDDIRHIQQWLEQQPHMHARKDDQWILNFLRSCKFSLEKTKQKLDAFYTMRKLMPQFLTNRDPGLPEIQELLIHGCILPLSKTLTEAGPRMFIVRLDDLNGGNNLKAAAKLILMICDILLYEDDNFVIGGQCILLDVKGASLEVAATGSIIEAKQLETLLEKGYPSRPQAFHVFNTTKTFESLYLMAKPLLSDKIKQRLHIYSNDNIQRLREIIPDSHFPKQYGGNGDCLIELAEYWKNKIESYRNWFLDDEKYGTDESKRLGKPVEVDGVFGIDGSFRKFELD